MPITNSVVTTPMRSEEPLTGVLAQMLDLGMLGAKTAAVLRRIRDGSELSEYGKSILERTIAMLNAVADSIESMASDSPSSGSYHVYGYETATLVAEATATESGEVDHEYLRCLAKKLQEIQSSPDAESADKLDKLVWVFSALARRATSSAGSPGDTTLSF